MAEGDPVTKVASDVGVPMIEGDPTEPVGPEDAAGHGVKRGDYSSRSDHPDKQHFQMEADDDGVVSAFDQRAAMQTDPGVPEAGEKGGVTSAEGAEGEVENDENVITSTATGGTFTVTVDGETTGNVAENATAAALETALTALSNVDAADVNVTGAAGGPWTLEWTGQYAGGDGPDVSVEDANATGGTVVLTS